jgi:hypothetical protein
MSKRTKRRPRAAASLGRCCLSPWEDRGFQLSPWILPASEALPRLPCYMGEHDTPALSCSPHGLHRPGHPRCAMASLERRGKPQPQPSSARDQGVAAVPRFGHHRDLRRASAGELRPIVDLIERDQTRELSPSRLSVQRASGAWVAQPSQGQAGTGRQGMGYCGSGERG